MRGLSTLDRSDNIQAFAHVLDGHLTGEGAERSSATKQQPKAQSEGLSHPHCQRRRGSPRLAQAKGEDAWRAVPGNEQVILLVSFLLLGSADEDLGGGCSNRVD